VLKLFYAVDTCALGSHIALEEAGSEYDAVRLEFRTNDLLQNLYRYFESDDRAFTSRYRYSCPSRKDLTRMRSSFP
jgi:hypothetical protein